MNQLINKRMLLSATILLIASAMNLSGLAFAEQVVNTLVRPITNGPVVSPANPQIPASSASTADPTSISASQEQRTRINALMQQFKQQGQDQVNAQIKVEKVHTEQQRQQACEARKADLTKRMGDTVTTAQKHKDTFDSIYAKVKTYYTTKNLRVSNYADLAAKVDAAQADSANKISALQSLDIKVDCTQVDSLATNLSAFKAAVGATRDSLKTYKNSLVNLITAISNSQSSSGGTNSSTNHGAADRGRR